MQRGTSLHTLCSLLIFSNYAIMHVFDCIRLQRMLILPVMARHSGVTVYWSEGSLVRKCVPVQLTPCNGECGSEGSMSSRIATPTYFFDPDHYSIPAPRPTTPLTLRTIFSYLLTDPLYSLSHSINSAHIHTLVTLKCYDLFSCFFFRSQHYYFSTINYTQLTLSMFVI